MSNEYTIDSAIAPGTTPTLAFDTDTTTFYGNTKSITDNTSYKLDTSDLGNPYASGVLYMKFG